MHPFDKNITEFMTEDSTKPKTNREWMMKLSGSIIELTRAVIELRAEIKSVVDTEIKTIKAELDLLKEWKSEWNGSWKLVIVLGGILTLITGVIAVILFFNQ